MNQWLLRDAAAISIPRRVICACGISLQVTERHGK